MPVSLYNSLFAVQLDWDSTDVGNLGKLPILSTS